MGQGYKIGSAQVLSYWARVVAPGCPSDVTVCDATAFAEAGEKDPVSVPFLI